MNQRYPKSRLPESGVVLLPRTPYLSFLAQHIYLYYIASHCGLRLITCPIELVKIRQQNIVDQQPSTRTVALDIFRKTGVRGLYRGVAPTALRDIGYGAYFATVSLHRLTIVFDYINKIRYLTSLFL